MSLTCEQAATAILARYFSESRYLVVPADATTVPLVAARLARSTTIFSAGQRVYVYDAYWGMNERALVLGRYRRRHRWVRGVCAIDILVDCRPQLVWSRAVIARLEGCSIAAGLFQGRLWPMPAGAMGSSVEP